MIKVFLGILLFFLISCSEIEFVYKDSKNILNPIYDKTSYTFTGKDIPSAYRYAARFFGNSKNSNFDLKVSIQEEKIKRSVQSNQAVSKLDYELAFDYELVNIQKSCLVYVKKIISRFSYIPKASGYNFGSDQSLEKLYDLAVENNFEQFVRSYSGNVNLENCINEN